MMLKFLRIQLYMNMLQCVMVEIYDQSSHYMELWAFYYIMCSNYCPHITPYKLQTTLIPYSGQVFQAHQNLGCAEFTQ